PRRAPPVRSSVAWSRKRLAGRPAFLNREGLIVAGYAHGSLPSATSQGINRQRTRTAKYQRHQARDVEQVDFIPRRPKLGPLGSQADCVDSTEAVLDVHGEHRAQHRKDQWNPHDGDKSSHEKRQAAKHLEQGHQPGVRERPWHPYLPEKLGKDRWSPTPFGPSMDHEPHTEDHSNRYRNPFPPPVAIQKVKHGHSFREIARSRRTARR